MKRRMRGTSAVRLVPIHGLSDESYPPEVSRPPTRRRGYSRTRGAEFLTGAEFPTGWSREKGGRQLARRLPSPVSIHHSPVYLLMIT